MQQHVWVNKVEAAKNARCFPSGFLTAQQFSGAFMLRHCDSIPHHLLTLLLKCSSRHFAGPEAEQAVGGPRGCASRHLRWRCTASECFAACVGRSTRGLVRKGEGGDRDVWGGGGGCGRERQQLNGSRYCPPSMGMEECVKCPSEQA